MCKKWFVCLVLLGAACSGSSNDSSSGAQSDDAPVGDQSSTDAQSDAESVPTTEAEVGDEPGLPVANGVEIEQLSAKSGGGVRPMLTWTAVSDADSYTVTVYDAEGSAWWSWSGSDTEVVIGGVDTDTEIGGPRADAGVRWSVMAFDIDGNLVGSSPRRSIEP